MIWPWSLCRTCLTFSFSSAGGEAAWSSDQGQGCFNWDQYTQSRHAGACKVAGVKASRTWNIWHASGAYLAKGWHWSKIMDLATSVVDEYRMWFHRMISSTRNMHLCLLTSWQENILKEVQSKRGISTRGYSTILFISWNMFHILVCLSSVRHYWPCWASSMYIDWKVMCLVQYDPRNIMMSK